MMTTTPGATGKRAGWDPPDATIVVLVALSAGVLYLLTLTSGAYFTRDTVLYAQWVEEGWGAFHAQHLAYVPLGQLFYTIWRVLGYTGRALLPLQVLSGIIGGLNAGLLYVALRRLTGRRGALLTTAFFVLSYGSWRYSVESDPYPLTMMGLLLVLVLLVRPQRRDLSWATLIGAATALASLFTLSGGLLAPVVLVALWGTPSDGRNPKEKALISIAYLLVAGFMIAGAYTGTAIWTEGVRTVGDLFRYLTRFIRGSSGWLGTGQALSWRSFLKAVPGVANVFVGEVPLLRWLQSTSWGWELFYTVSPAAVLVEKGTTAGSLSWDVFFASALSLSAFALLAIGTVWLLRRWKTIRVSHLGLVRAMLLWFTVFGLGALVWLPECVHFWLPNLVPLCVLIALAHGSEAQTAPRETRSTLRGWVIALVFIAAANLVGSILPLRDPSSNPYVPLVQTLKGHVPPGAAIVTLGGGEYRHAPAYLEYYLHCTAMPARRVFIAPDDRRRQDYSDALTTTLRTAIENGAGAYALSDLFESELGYAQLVSWGNLDRQQIRQGIESLLAPWELKPLARHDGRLTLYELLPLEPAVGESTEKER